MPSTQDLIRSLPISNQLIKLGFKQCQAELEGSSNSNWGDNNPVHKWSTTGYCYALAGAPMSWESHKQNTTATSSTEAEYTVQCGAVKEAIYLRQFLNELRRPIIQPTVINADNTDAIALAKDPVQHKRSRHIDFLPLHQRKGR